MKSTGSLAEMHALLRAWTWRHTGLGLLLGAALLLLGPGGSALLWPLPGNPNHWQTLLHYSLGYGLPLVLFVGLADRAVEAGSPAWRSYGGAVLLVALFGSWAGWLLEFSGYIDQRASPLRNGWLALSLLINFGLGVAGYALWRRSRQAQDRARALGAASARHELQLQLQQLLTLQAQIEPQLLFDALGRIAELARRDPAAADDLLAELIALLRGLLPGRQAAFVNLGRQFELLATHARVSNRPEPLLDLGPGLARASMAPLLLPLLRAVPAESPACRLSARREGDRLQLVIEAALPEAAIIALRQELNTLYPEGATVHHEGPLLRLDLPYRHDDERPDR